MSLNESIVSNVLNNLLDKVKNVFCKEGVTSVSTQEPKKDSIKPEIPGPVKLPVSREDFDKLFPKAVGVYSALEKYAKIYNVHEPDSFSAFVAQCSHESGGFSTTVENLNYSESALNSVFAKYFKNAGRSAASYARKPESIANVVYANRMGNGSTASGDGWKFRGRGYIQLTGKDNYVAFSKDTGIDVVSNPDIIQRDPLLCLLTAFWYWDKNNLNRFVKTSDFKGLTKAINGGYNGLADRVKMLNKIYALCTKSKL